MIDLNDMALFAKVAELKGISAAARVLDMPKSRVSRRVALLEKSLNTRLLERTTRAVSLTETGKVFALHCQKVLEEAESAQVALSELSESPKGLLRISASVSIGQHVIAPHLGEFCQLYPDIEIELNLTNRRVDLIAEGFDLVVRVGELQDSTLISRRMGNATAVICASREYLKTYGHPKGLEDLHQHKTLVMSDSSFAKKWRLIEINSQQETSIEIKPQIAINDMATLKQAIVDHCGIGLLPKFLIKDELAAKQLIRVLPEWKTPTFNYFIVYPSRLGLTKKAKAWVEFFKEKFK